MSCFLIQSKAVIIENYFNQTVEMEEKEEKNEESGDREDQAEKIEDENEQVREEDEAKEQETDVNVENSKKYDSTQKEYSAEKDIANEQKSNAEALEVEKPEEVDDDAEAMQDEETAKKELKSGRSDAQQQPASDYTHDLSSKKRKSDESVERKRKLGKKNENRVLETDETNRDKLEQAKSNPIDVEEEENDDKDQDVSGEAADEFKHLRNEKEKFDKQVYDAATEKQKENAIKGKTFKHRIKRNNLIS